MKNKKPLLIGLSALAISALAVPITIKALQRNKPQFTTTDPITYDDKSETTIVLLNILCQTKLISFISTMMDVVKLEDSTLGLMNSTALNKPVMKIALIH